MTYKKILNKTSRVAWKADPKACAGCRSISQTKSHKLAFNNGRMYWFCRKCYQKKFNNDGGGNLTVVMKK